MINTEEMEEIIRKEILPLEYYFKPKIKRG